MTAQIAVAASVPAPRPANAPTAHIHLAGQGDQICEARLFKKNARLTMKGGQPVSYKWHNRSERNAELRGNTIHIDNGAATISNVVMGRNANGQQTITGDFKFQNNRQNNLVFTCKPD